jgi:hypothetical protein
VAKLGDSVQIPRGLGAIGMKREQLNEMAELASGSDTLVTQCGIRRTVGAVCNVCDRAHSVDSRKSVRS